MTVSKSKTAFDPELVRALAGLLHETGLSEIEYDSGGWRVRVARSAALLPQPAAAPPGVTAPDAAGPAQAPSARRGFGAHVIAHQHQHWRPYLATKGT